jgi:hypothetical protein
MRKRIKDERAAFLETMLKATKEGSVKWIKIKNQDYWETRKEKNWVVFHPSDTGCVSMNYSVDGLYGLFNIWPEDKDAVILGKELNGLITGEYKKELQKMMDKRASLSEIADMFLK